MTSKERIQAVLEGKKPDHIPLTTWSFGFPAPKHLQWETNGKKVDYWYSKRLEHIHDLPQPWELEDEFKRALAWQSVGIDDILEVSVPWSTDAEVTFEDGVLEAGDPEGDKRYPVMVREYQTPSGRVRHAVKKTGDEEPGWPPQPDYVPLIEDYNIPRAIEHAVSKPSDVEAIKHLYAEPSSEQKEWFSKRMEEMKTFSAAEGFLVQAWTAFGMDAAVWFTGTENAVMMAIDAPREFARLMEIIAQTDYERTRVAVENDGVDLVCQRGWYGSTDFWSPVMFDEFIVPHLSQLTQLAHEHGKKFAYTMTTGVETLGPRLADAGVDALCFVDPIMDTITLERAAALLGGRMTLFGGTNAVSLIQNDKQRIEKEIKDALQILGPTNRFILHPTDAIFPDTPWEGVEAMIQAWEKYR